MVEIRRSVKVEDPFTETTNPLSVIDVPENTAKVLVESGGWEYATSRFNPMPAIMIAAIIAVGIALFFFGNIAPQ